MPLTLPLTHSDLYLLFKHFLTCIRMKQSSPKMVHYMLKHHHYEKKNEKQLWTSCTQGVWCALILRLYDNPQHSSKVYPSVNTVFPGKPKVKKSSQSPKIWFRVSLTLRQREMNIRGFVLAFIRSCRYLEMGMQAWGGVDGSQPSKPFLPRPFCESTLISLSSSERQDCGPGSITSVNVSWC